MKMMQMDATARQQRRLEVAHQGQETAGPRTRRGWRGRKRGHPSPTRARRPPQAYLGRRPGA